MGDSSLLVALDNVVDIVNVKKVSMLEEVEEKGKGVRLQARGE